MIAIQIELVTLQCDHEGCGITFAVPEKWMRGRQNDHQNFYCPNGHPRWFPGKSEAEKLRDELSRSKAERERLERERNEAHRKLLAAQKAEKRHKRRISNGVCPCCTRSFQDLKRHMASKHPEFSEGRS
jgi:hypothetical protein